MDIGISSLQADSQPYSAVADPEVLSRGDELRGHKGGGPGEGAMPRPQKILNFKSKNCAFLCTFKY